MGNIGNDAWKPVQGLKDNVQNRSFNESDAVLKTVFAIEAIKDAEVEQRWMKYGTEEQLEESLRDENVLELRKYFNYCLHKNKPIAGKIADVEFCVNREDPTEISFMDRHGRYKTTIKGNDIFSEAEVLKARKFAHYRNSDGANIPVIVTQTIYVVDGEELNEYYTIELQEEWRLEAEAIKDKTSAIVQDVLKNKRRI